MKRPSKTLKKERNIANNMQLLQNIKKMVHLSVFNLLNFKTYKNVIKWRAIYFIFLILSVK